MRYFDLSEKVTPGIWMLGVPFDPRTGKSVSGGVFLDGERLQVTGPLRIPIADPGRALDFSLADIGTAPVVHVKIASLLAEMAPDDVQLIPVEIDSQPDQYCILNALRLVKCVDDGASAEVHYWTPDDGEPNREGKYINVFGLRIDPSKVGDAKVFRPWGWEIALIVSEDVKNAMERLGVTGADFEEVG